MAACAVPLHLPCLAGVTDSPVLVGWDTHFFIHSHTDRKNTPEDKTTHFNADLHAGVDAQSKNDILFDIHRAGTIHGFAVSRTANLTQSLASRESGNSLEAAASLTVSV